MHSCLRFHKSFISERCAAEENKLAAVEFRDIRLRPKLAKVCSEERAVYCKVRGKESRQGLSISVGCVMLADGEILSFRGLPAWRSDFLRVLSNQSLTHMPYSVVAFFFCCTNRM